MTSRSGAIRSLLAILAVLLSALLAGGCDRAGAEPAKVESRAQGAAPEHYLADYKATQSAGPAGNVTPSPKPTAPLAAGASCVTAECHANMKSARFIHGPVSERACGSCHSDDTGKHVFPLKRQKNDTCTFCHAVSGTAAHQHKALEQGCTSCHRPHESATKFLLKGMSVEDLCSRCHEVPLKRFAHTPFAKGECSTCHQPHQSDGPHLLRAKDEMSQCLTCHDGMKKAMTVAGVKVHKPVKEACTNCHTPHASDLAGQLKASTADTCFKCHEDVKKHASSSKVGHAAMLEEKACANCHDPHASVQPGLLKDRADAVCLTCHNKPVKAADGRTIADMRPALGAKSLHGPVKAANCSACHSVHGAPNDGLLKQPFPKTFYTSFKVEDYALCFSCHEKELVLTEKTLNLTNFRNGQKNLHFVHVNREEKGRTCKTCHAVHGSDSPKHMASDVPMGDGRWSMPIGFEQTPDGGRCASGCHKPREYNRNRPVPPATQPVTTAAVGGAS